MTEQRGIATLRIPPAYHFYPWRHKISFITVANSTMLPCHFWLDLCWPEKQEVLVKNCFLWIVSMDNNIEKCRDCIENSVQCFVLRIQYAVLLCEFVTRFFIHYCGLSFLAGFVLSWNKKSIGNQFHSWNFHLLEWLATKKIAIKKIPLYFENGHSCTNNSVQQNLHFLKCNFPLDNHKLTI